MKNHTVSRDRFSPKWAWCTGAGVGISLINISANFWSGDDLEIEEGEVVMAGCRIEREGREEKREGREGGEEGRRRGERQ